MGSEEMGVSAERRTEGFVHYDVRNLHTELRMKSLRWRYRCSAVLLVGTLGVAGCSDQSPTQPGEAPAMSITSLLNFVKCTPQPYAKAGAYIGPSGGTISAGFGKIQFAKNALSTTTYITLEALSDTVNSVRVRPEGMKFPANTVTLTISSKNCPGSLGQSKRIVYVSDDLRSLLESLLSSFSSGSETTSAKLNHFSRYAVHR